jgi:regulator of PEP synthase PpsR (kinase-PPPase family)
VRTAFYISDGTGITSEVFGHALLSLFPAEFDHVTIPFVETAQIALQVKQRINDRYKTTGIRPLIFQTFVDEELRNIINSSDGVCYDFLNAFI